MAPMRSSALDIKSPSVFQFHRWELEFWLAFICISLINWEALLWSICLRRLPVPYVFVSLLKFALMTNTEISYKYMPRILTLAFLILPISIPKYHQEVSAFVERWVILKRKPWVGGSWTAMCSLIVWPWGIFCHSKSLFLCGETGL